MVINFFNSETILRLTPLAKDTETIADEMLAGNVKIFPKLLNVRVDSLEDLWEMKFDSAPSTYAVYLYALYPVSYLLNAYELTRRDGYLNNALELAMSFLNWELENKKRINKKREKILFGDHAVSNRTQVLCYLVCCLKGKGYEINDDIKAALLRYGEYLADINNYSHYNHGLMMDLALLGLLNTLEGLNIEYPSHLKENLIVRLQYSITRDLTEDGVHIENSPGYHFWMLGFLRRITPALQGFDSQIFFQVKDLFEKAKVYADYITRSDGSVPTIGDTHSGLKYKPNKELESKFFSHANQVIFRNSKSDIWAHLLCGYKTHVHKHSDNGAFTLYYKGRDLLIDPGFLNYENSDESLLLKSASFHNTTCLKSEEQEIKKIEISGNNPSYTENISGSKIASFIQLPNVESAFSIISEHVDYSIYRLVVWLKPKSFVIFDTVHLASETTLEQFFHIAPGLHIDMTAKNNIQVLSGNSVQCTLSPISVDGLSSGSYEIEALPGCSASSFNETKESFRLKVTSNQGYICTLITLEDDIIDKSVLSFLKYENFKKLMLDVEC